ncbi:MAG: ATP-sensitive inward rectifier potassium channel 10 [Cyanobacteria bacterium SID2]|nr:ATP-sensitive inward rectifier potassium channel 10 [Cyanobacteria bacterium SID2]
MKKLFRKPKRQESRQSATLRLQKRKTRILVSRIGKYRLIEMGIPGFDWSDLYHWLLSLSWGGFLGLVALTYLLVNLLFAAAYVSIDGNGIANAEPGSFLDAFFFSVQTMATIGYGAMYPQSLATHLIVSFEVLVGLLGVAMATGLMFARFTLPSARVLFGQFAVVCPYNGTPTLMFRAANRRGNFIVEAQFRVSVLLPEQTSEGHVMRRLHDLELVRSETPFFSLSMTLMHPIDESSPLFGKSASFLSEVDTQIVVMMTGLDETVSQTIHASKFYTAGDVCWNTRFVDIISIQPNGDRYVDYDRFHDIEPMMDDL